MNALNENAKENVQARSATGLKTAVAILGKWGATVDAIQAVLRVSRATFFKAKSGSIEAINLDSDQLDRISLVLNMHAALRIVFDNPDNVYGFMAMKNNNDFFNGRTPLESMENGSFMSVYETFKRVDALRGAQW